MPIRVYRTHNGSQIGVIAATWELNPRITRESLDKEFRRNNDEDKWLVMISLGCIALPDLIWEGEFDWTGIVGASDRTLGGLLVVWEGSVVRGRAFDLVAYDDMGWPTRAQLQSVQALAALPGWRGALIYESVSLQVRFRTEDPPVIDMESKLPRPNHASGDYYFGRIKLATV